MVDYKLCAITDSIEDEFGIFKLYSSRFKNKMTFNEFTKYIDKLEELEDIILKIVIENYKLKNVNSKNKFRKMDKKEIQTNWEMLCCDVLTIKQIELLKQKFQLIKEEAQKELLDELWDLHKKGDKRFDIWIRYKREELNK